MFINFSSVAHPTQSHQIPIKYGVKGSLIIQNKIKTNLIYHDHKSVIPQG